MCKATMRLRISLSIFKFQVLFNPYLVLFKFNFEALFCLETKAAWPVFSVKSVG
jgi:hypothetical protein